MTNENKKGYREMIKQIADRQRSYSLAYYVRNIEKKAGKKVSKSQVRTAIKRLTAQYKYRGLTVQNDRVYNYTFANVA